MKKKALSLFILAVITIAGFIIGKSFGGAKPFHGLSVSEISSISVKLSPPDVTFELTANDIEEVVDILHTIVVYSKDNSYRNYAGQAVVLTITKTDGTHVTATAFNPFFIIDGIGYKTKYEPCEKLNSWANKLRYQ